MTKKNNIAISIVVLLGLLFHASCYRAENVPPDTPPTYSIKVDGYDGYKYSYQSMTDSAVTLTVIDSSNTQISQHLWFWLISGNPTNYPLKCYFSNTPPGITGYFDTLNFRLNYIETIHLVATTCPAGTYPVNLNIYNDRLGLKTYPFNIHVITH